VIDADALAARRLLSVDGCGGGAAPVLTGATHTPAPTRSKPIGQSAAAVCRIVVGNNGPKEVAGVAAVGSEVVGAAKLSIASATAVEQRLIATRSRGLHMPDLELPFMSISSLSLATSLHMIPVV